MKLWRLRLWTRIPIDKETEALEERLTEALGVAATGEQAAEEISAAATEEIMTEAAEEVSVAANEEIVTEAAE